MPQWFVAAIVVCVLTGCDDAGRSFPRLPTSPTSVTTSTWPVKPVDRRFDDAFWLQLVYNDQPSFRYPASRVLVDPGRLNVYVDVSRWPAALPQAEWLPWIKRQWSGWIRSMTGETWTGSFESGTDYDYFNPPAGVIGILWAEDRSAVCGASPVGDWPDRGYIRLFLNRSNCSYMRSTLQHELGHVLGFSHVREPWTVMNGDYPYDTALSPREQYHMRLAYEVGRGRPYCGWPYSAAC